MGMHIFCEFPKKVRQIMPAASRKGSHSLLQLWSPLRLPLETHKAMFASGKPMKPCWPTAKPHLTVGAEVLHLLGVNFCKPTLLTVGAEVLQPPGVNLWPWVVPASGLARWCLPAAWQGGACQRLGNLCFNLDNLGSQPKAKGGQSNTQVN